MHRSQPATTLVVADDHPVYRAGLVDAIGERDELELLAACGGGREALAGILELQPDAALLDVRMRDFGGIEVLEELVRAHCETRVIFLSAFEDGDLVHRALTVGGAGYLSKETDRDEICDAVLAAVGGEVVVSHTLPGALVDYLRRQAEVKPPALGAREHEVMRLTAEGLSGPQIAVTLGIGSTTVKTHLQRVYRKLEVTDRAAMVAKALRQGLLT
ncbi:MAG: two-component system, NarL family, nitrate/nitrite response regulator NarL [Solirubrobacteraceae bacterium]|jgi:two-component system nitrate/nitrite response regulator NarL|nr:two-component system, NarL family, nitrate/nitrite response regulator NarL [Solirubrobacteraceae bacterium]